jgi:hypothetical protein
LSTETVGAIAVIQAAAESPDTTESSDSAKAPESAAETTTKSTQAAT